MEENAGELRRERAVIMSSLQMTPTLNPVSCGNRESPSSYVYFIWDTTGNQDFHNATEEPRVIVVPQYPWQIDLLKHGFVSLSHAICGCRLNHLYFVPLPVLIGVVLGTRCARAQNSKERFQEMPIITHLTRDRIQSSPQPIKDRNGR